MWEADWNHANRRFEAGQWVNVHGKGLRDCECPQVKGPEYCRAHLSRAEAAADAKHPGWACLDALLQPLVHVPRGPNPAQICFEMPPRVGGRSCTQIHAMGKHTQVASVHG